jgi:hypothetical protein
MSEDDPNPLVDVAKGLGLLFRAARTAAKKLPSKELEEAVVTSAKEVGRAFENVAATIEREVFRGGSRDRSRGWTSHDRNEGSGESRETERDAAQPTPPGDDAKKDEGPKGPGA